MGTKDQKTEDGFMNFLSGLGLGAQNTFSAGEYTPETLSKDRLKLENMYRGSWVVGAAVDCIAEDMIRAGIDIGSELDQEREREIQSYLTGRKIWKQIEEAIKWGRLYGGSLAILDIEGQDPASPLDYSTIQRGQFRGVQVLDRWQVQPDVTQISNSGINAGQPEFYTILADGVLNRDSEKYHWSRCLKFIGVRLPYWQEVSENFWGASVLERIQDRIIAFDSATLGAANLLERAYNRMVGIEGLREILAMGGKAQNNLVTMFKMMAFLQRNEGITLLDKNDEYQVHSYSFSGIPETLYQFGEQISGALGIPLVRLFGQSPAGLNSSGESDIRMYYDNIRSRQESTLREGLYSILRAIHNDLFEEDVPKGFNFTFNPLWQETQKEKIENASLICDVIQKAYDAEFIDKQTAVDELKQSSQATGIFTNADYSKVKEELPDVPTPPGGENSEEKKEGKSEEKEGE